MTTLLTIVTAALILIIINQININRTNKARIIDLEAQNKYLDKPLYNITIYAVVKDNEIIFKIKDNPNGRRKIIDQYVNDNNNPNLCLKEKFLRYYELEFTNAKEAEEFISKKLIERAITIENTFDCSTIKMN